MGKMQRTKGKVFERKIAKLFRDRWPEATVRRASQADRAYQSDVFVTGGPPILEQLWIECQDARNPTPMRKLEQAKRDSFEYAHRLPVAICHETGTRETNVTMPMWVLGRLCNETLDEFDAAVTVSIGTLLDLVDEHQWKAE